MRSIKAVSIMILLALCLTTASSPARAIEETAPELSAVQAETYVLMLADSGQVLLEHERDKALPPASMTKLMTLLLAVEALEESRASLDDIVTTSEHAWSMGGSQIYLEPGEEMSYQDMLMAIAVGSANDACVAVAEFLEGSEEAFVDKMNARAQEIGMKNTHFANTNGLHEAGHVTSAYDMALLACHILQHPMVMEYTKVKEYDLRGGEFKLYNTNKLLWWFKGTDGMKTGWTTEAKYCLTSTVERDGLRLVAVVMASPKTNGHFSDSMLLHNYGFARYSWKEFLAADEGCGSVTVGKGKMEEVGLHTAEAVGIACLKEQLNNVSAEAVLLPYVEAPVYKGQKLGEYKISVDGVLSKQVDIVAAQDVPRGGIFREILKLWDESFTI
ncbi:MAG: D-alanyl-D-alanine carboxypeptidase family protein [Syntrophomonadaceae bacterium]|nr:D-alanyl-D-alanine carboxypeptidase family protein [Syntrophomonadaceae bacterium]